MRRSGTFAIVLMVLFSTATRALAQPKAGAEVRVAVGLSFQGGIFGDDSPRQSQGLGLTLGAQTRWKPERGTGMVLDVEFQPVALKNPHFNERLRVLSIQVAPEIGKNIYIRPGAGIALHLWSGNTESAVSLGPTAGIAIGVHRNVGASARISPEIIARASMEPGALAWTFGAQVPVSWGRR